jgi:hypothetical protein
MGALGGEYAAAGNSTWSWLLRYHGANKGLSEVSTAQDTIRQAIQPSENDILLKGIEWCVHASWLKRVAAAELYVYRLPPAGTPICWTSPSSTGSRC